MHRDPSEQKKSYPWLLHFSVFYLLSNYSIKKLNWLLELNISYPKAILGGKVDIPTVYGAAKLKIPSGIQSGQVLRMKGKGFPRLRSNSKGDQLVKIQVNTPSKINRKIKKYITELDSELDPIKVPFTKIKL